MVHTRGGFKTRAMDDPIPFNRATVAPRQMEYIAECFAGGHISGDGGFSARVCDLLRGITSSGEVLLTPSGTDALEMAALLLDLQPGDEVIVPAYTFVSTANAFAIFGARPVFADSDPRHLNIDPDHVRSLVTSRTRAIVAVHYGGVACDLAELSSIAEGCGAMLIEDNAHGLFGTFGVDGRPLGSVGAISALSFHETKNISCGEGGALLINDPALVARAEVIREKGTNRRAFFRGHIDKYTWVDLGSSYLLAEPLAATLAAQLEHAGVIQQRRHEAWHRYSQELAEWADDVGATLSSKAPTGEHPAHLFAITLGSAADRPAFIEHMRSHSIYAAFHYQALNASPFASRLPGPATPCPVAERASECLVRLPLFSDMRSAEIERVICATALFRRA